MSSAATVEKLERYWYKVPIELARAHLKRLPGWSVLNDKYIRVPSNMLPFLPPEAINLEWAKRPKFLPREFDAYTAKLGWKLRDYQHAGRLFLLNKRGALLADAPRIGKTAQIVSSHELKDGQLLVVGPLMTRAVWLTWFKKRWPAVVPITLKGRKKQDLSILKDQPLVFVNYDIISGWQNTVCPPHTVVFDEAHLLSNPKTKRFGAAQLVASQAKKVVCATGTPLWNKPAGAWGILDLLEPGGWGSYFNFTQRYAAGKYGQYGWTAEGLSNEDELKIRLSTLMLRREWEDVRADLPPIGRNLEIIELSAEERTKLDVKLEISRGRGAFRTAIADNARLRRIFANEHKVGAAVHLASNYLARGDNVVVWCWHKDIAEAIETLLIGDGYHALTITGETTHKDSVLETWRSLPCGALVITLGVGQTGIDLSHAKHAVFAEIDYTPAVMSQAEMRTFNADRPMTVDYVLTDHPLEMAIVKGLIRKCKMASKTGLPAADTNIEFLSEIFTEDELLWDELEHSEGGGGDSLLTDLFGEAMDDGMEDFFGDE